MIMSVWYLNISCCTVILSMILECGGASMTGAGAGHMCITAQLPAPVDNGRKCAVTSYRSQQTGELRTGPHFVQSLARSPQPSFQLPDSRFQLSEPFPRICPTKLPPSTNEGDVRSRGINEIHPMIILADKDPNFWWTQSTMFKGPIRIVPQ